MCLTLGSKGGKVYDKTGLRFRCPAPRITLANTVDSGNLFYACSLVSLKRLGALSGSPVLALSQSNLEIALRFATAFASYTATPQESDPAWNFKVH